MGYQGEIRATALASVYPTEYHLMLPWHRSLFYLSGGLFQGIIFLIMCIFDRDEEDRLANKMVAIQGFIYMFFEAFTNRMWWETGATVGLIISFAFMAVVLIKKGEIVG